MPHSEPIIEVLTVFRPLFNAPTWRKLMTLLTGTLLAQGPRTVAAALRASGIAQATNWSCFHQVLNSLVTLFGQTLHPNGQIPVAQAAWHCKQTATFRDVLALVRRHLWGQGTFPTSPTDPFRVLVPRSTLERLSLAVC